MTVLHNLVRYYDRLENTGEVAPEGYASEKISFAIVLGRDGRIVDVNDLRDHSGKKPQPCPIVVPQPTKRGSNIVAHFLWDNTGYALGVSTKKKNLEKKHDAFRNLHENLLADTNDKALGAVLAFLRTWNPSMHPNMRYADEMLDRNVVFRLDVELEFIHERSTAKRIWMDHLAREEIATATCLVTGEHSSIARLHPTIKGVPGGQTSGVSLVSFNRPAFTSYGKNQGDNAPISRRAAHAYTTAFNTLLARRENGRARNRVQIGDTTVIFWAEAPGGVAEQAETVFSWTLDPPTTDEQEAAKVRSVLQKVQNGRIADIDELGEKKLDPTTKFYVLGVAANASRLAVRFYLESTLGGLLERGRQHYRDLCVEPNFWWAIPPIWRLLRETAVQGKSEKILPSLGNELARALLTGARYPRTLLTAILMRIRADGVVNDIRAAICKACIVRHQRMTQRKENVPVSLDINELNPGYRLGRLFATLESAQYAALGKVNANIRDKYFGSASANPARVFPLLLRGVQDHLGSLRSKGKGGLAYWFDGQIAEIMSGLPSSQPFPTTLRLDDQGRFAVGYYHQRNTRDAKREPYGKEELSPEEEEAGAE
jgi:CRISPR-associated protein Csd1